MREDEFTEDFEEYVMQTFFLSEPMNQHLQTKIPDDIDRPWLEQVLDQAKHDQLSVAFYSTDPNEQRFPIAYSINHHDRQHQHADLLYSSSSTGTSTHKHQHISNLMTKLHEDVHLFEQHQSEDSLHIYLLGVHPDYRQNRLASQLIELSIGLAREKGFDLVCADVTSRYSLNAFLKHGFEVIKTIDYHSYEDSSGEKVFQNMSTHQGCSIVLKDLRKQ